ncbi:hypothetical protein AgCh_022919 [Apium graveolens]
MIGNGESISLLPSITSNTVEKYLANVKSFSQGKKNCYTIQPSPRKDSQPHKNRKNLECEEVLRLDLERVLFAGAPVGTMLAYIDIDIPYVRQCE